MLEAADRASGTDVNKCSNLCVRHPSKRADTRWTYYFGAIDSRVPL